MTEIVLCIHGQRFCCDVTPEGEGFIVRLGGAAHAVRLADRSSGVFHVHVAGRAHLLQSARGRRHGFLHLDGQTVAYRRVEEGGARLSGGRSETDHLFAPMPGTVTRVLIAEGDEVALGQALVIVEAMKMEHVIRAPRGGRIRAIRVRPGEQVDGETTIVEMAKPDDAPAG